MPDYNAKLYKGDSINLREAFEGKVSMVNTWFIGCLPCMVEMPVMEDIYHRYKDRDDFAFYSIAANTENELNPFLDSRLDSGNIYKKCALRFNINRLAVPTIAAINLDHTIATRIKDGKRIPIGLIHADTEKMDYLARSFKSNAYPTTIIYNKQGKEVYRAGGFDTNRPDLYKKELVAKLDTLLVM